MQQLYPVLLDITHARILVVGAGAVAARKIRGLLDAGTAADAITVVAPQCAAGIPNTIRQIARPFSPTDLDGIGLCFAATDSPEVNARVCALCHERGILVNRADHEDGPGSTFTVPAMARSGAITVAVSAAGSPAIAARVRDTIAQQILPDWARFAEVAVAIREEILASGRVEPLARQAIFRTLASADAQAAYARGGEAAIRELLQERHPEIGRQ